MRFVNPSTNLSTLGNNDVAIHFDGIDNLARETVAGTIVLHAEVLIDADGQRGASRDAHVDRRCVVGKWLSRRRDVILRLAVRRTGRSRRVISARWCGYRGGRAVRA